MGSETDNTATYPGIRLDRDQGSAEIPFRFRFRGIPGGFSFPLPFPLSRKNVGRKTEILASTTHKKKLDFSLVRNFKLFPLPRKLLGFFRFRRRKENLEFSVSAETEKSHFRTALLPER